MKRSFLALVFCSSLLVSLHAQNFIEGWKSVDSLLSNQYYTQAYDMSDKLYQQALRQHDTRNSLIAAYYLSLTGEAFKEDNSTSSLERYQLLLPQLKDVDKALCHMLLASFYSDYYLDNSWRIRQNRATDETDLDYKLWDADRYRAVVEEHVRLAFSDKDALKNTRSESLGRLVTLDQYGNDGDLTPTLFDVMVYRTNHIFRSLGYRKLTDKNVSNPDNLAAVTQKFVTVKSTNIDSTQQMAAFILELNQERESLHHSLHNPDRVMIRLYLDRLSTMGFLFNLTNTTELYCKVLPDVIAHFRNGNDEAITLLYKMLADKYCNQNRRVEAMAMLDTALALHPKGRGVDECFNLKQSLLSPYIKMSVPSVMPSGRHGLSTVCVSNIDTLYFRVVEYVSIEKYNQIKDRNLLLNSKMYKQWAFPVVDWHDFRQRELFFAIPPLEQGHYMILASSNRAFDTIIDVAALRIEDVAIVKTDNVYPVGFVMNRVDGSPVKNLKVSLKASKNYYNKLKVIATTKTDNHGHFSFMNTDLSSYQRISYVVEYKGITIEEEDAVYRYYGNKESKSRIFFDRPVYRPGDTAHFTLVAISQKDSVFSLSVGRKSSFIVKDVNGKGVDSIPFFLDEYGCATGHYVIPTEALPGLWTVKTQYAYMNFNVEAYKQPKFTVTLSKPAEELSFGMPTHFDGIAASYSAVPVGGAKVAYSVTRSECVPSYYYGWWHWWRRREEKVVATGETVSDGDGHFRIEFVPTPDSVMNLSYKPVFKYVVKVSVTDINGESHEAETTLTVGYVKSYLSLTCYGDTVSISRLNFEGSMLDGKVSIAVDRLKIPDKVLLSSELFADTTIEMPYTYKEYERMFPYLDYKDSVNEYSNWSIDRRVYEGNGFTSTDKPLVYSLSGLAAGMYRVTASIATEDGDTLETCIYCPFEPTTSAMPVTSDLICFDAKNRICHVGDTVDIRVGSRHKDLTLYLLVRKDKDYYRQEIHHLSQGFVNLSIPVTDALKGGFVIELAAMKENIFDFGSIYVDVPRIDKELDVSLETFRDKLVPGTPERWTLRIKEKDSGNPAKANLMMTMYDATIERYGTLSWNLDIWPRHVTNNILDVFHSKLNSRSLGYCVFLLPMQYVSPTDDFSYRVYELVSALTTYRFYGKVRGESHLLMSKSAAVNNLVDAVATEEREVMTDSEDLASEASDGSGEENGAPLYIRQNLSTSAFFRPTLRSDDSGIVELSFTAPDLLSRWNICGLAWTRELRVGSLSESVVTQKPLMVVPNVPRFLRHGDTCLFSVKVSNMDDRQQQVAVTLRMTDAGSSTVLPMVVGDTVQTIILQAGTSGEVHFTLAVPRAPYFAANYMVVARGEGCSDGEQAAIPLLPSRQLVIESMAFYINGVGEKHYEMKHLTGLDTAASDITLSTLGLTVDLTPNPIWMVMQSLPYVSQCQNPSNIYLANAIYTNSLSYAIVNGNPLIEQLFREWEKDGYDAFVSELERNSDLKQTVMSETPWLRDAVGEEQRHRDVARFFNKSAITSQLKKDIERLLAAQRSDGGWSWIDGADHSSLYTTQYILKMFGMLRRQGISPDSRTMRALNNAMDFVDRETYRYYEKYIKNRGYDAVNLDYLYVRSFYPDNKLNKKQKEAYDFFYNNALKNNKNYRSLYLQSLLCVVFNRHGDTKLAREMATRIKEKALYSDEMGMYWRDNVAGWSWSERPIETQAMMIRIMDEVLGDRESVARMQQWILKQKQATNWNTDVSTVNAISALLAGNGNDGSAGTPVRLSPSRMTLTFGSHRLVTDTSRHQLHVSQHLKRGEVTPADGSLTIRKEDEGIAWGSMYWQYFEQIDKIPSSNMGVTLKRTLYRVGDDGKLSRVHNVGIANPGEQGIANPGEQSLRVGDKVRIRIEIAVDRNLEYLELKDPRCAAMEPLSTASGWHWNGGLSYYLSVTNTAQTLYIDRLDKGKYIVEYDMFVNNAGTFVTAPTTIQCLYAPEFRALAPAEALKIQCSALRPEEQSPANRRHRP